MSNTTLPVILIPASGADNKSAPNQAIQDDLREVLSELSAKIYSAPDEIEGELALFVSAGLLNPSPEHFDFLLEGLEEFDLVIQPSLSGQILALAVNWGDQAAQQVARDWLANPKVMLLSLAEAASQSALEFCVQPPWYGTIDGQIGIDFAYQHMATLALSPESEPLAIRTLEWLRKERQA